MPDKGDTYNIGQGVGVGRNVKMTHVTVNQGQGQSKSFDMPTLASELERLRAELKKLATEPEHDMAIGAIAAAEAEAKNGDESTTLDYLAKAGQWALDVAIKIGVPVAIEAIKKSVGG